MLTLRAKIYAEHQKQDLAFRDLKEALSLTPQNGDIADAIRSLQNMSLTEPTEKPIELIDKFINGDRKAGETIANNMASEVFAKSFVDLRLLSLLLEKGVQANAEICGQVLLRLSMNNSKEVSEKLTSRISSTFATDIATFLACRSEGIEALTNIILKTWKDEQQRHQAIKALIPELTEHLRRTKVANDDSIHVAVLNSFIRLATSDPGLKTLDDRPDFSVLLPLLSSEYPQSIRSRTIVLLSTMISNEDRESTVVSLIKQKLQDTITYQFLAASSAGYIAAFSILGSVFTFRSDVAAEVFLEEGFLEEALEDALEIHDDGIPKALLGLLSAASVDKGCRAKILKDADGFLKKCAQSTSDTEKRALSGSILAKLASASTQTPEIEIDLVKIFADAYSSKNDTALLSAVEGLAFSSTVAQKKEELAKNSKFLQSLLGIVKSPSREHTLIYGSISILVNLTSYKRPLTEEEKRINEIHRLAKEANVHTVDKLDDNAHVTARCKAILSAGLLPTLNVMAVNSSPACITAIAHILLSVSTAPAHRGLLAQQGAIKLIIALLGKSVDQNTEVTLAHAMAKILISINPSLIFSSRTPITTPIQPLTTLLTNESLPNELPRFETLLALTNLASTDDSARTSIVDKAWTVTEALLLSDIPLLQRAATELVCNLVVCQKGAEKFLPSKTSSAISRLHLLLALADLDDVATRRAAGGALAMLTDLKESCDAVGEVERGVERICGMVGDGDEDVAFRGIICVKNMTENGGTDLKKRISVAGTVSKIQELKKRTANGRLQGLCDEILGQLT